MGQHDCRRNKLTDRSGQSCTENPQIQREYTEIIPEGITHAADDHRFGCQPRIAVVAQIGREDIAEQAAGNRKENRPQIGIDQLQQFLVGTEKPEHRVPEQPNADHHQHRQRRPIQYRQGEILLCRLLLPFSAVVGKQHRAADTGQQSQAVHNAPQGIEHGKSRISGGTVILPHHHGIHQTKDRGDQCTSRCRHQILDINRFDPISQQIHS